MLIKLIYILFFAIANFIIYSKLNNTGKVSKAVFISFTIAFVIIVLLHNGIFNVNMPIRAKDFQPLIFFLFFPVFSYLFFTFFGMRMFDNLRDKGVNERFLDYGLRVFSLFFLKFVYLMAFVGQCTFIFSLKLG